MPPSPNASRTTVATAAAVKASRRRCFGEKPVVSARNMDATSTGPTATNSVANAVGKMWNTSGLEERDHRRNGAAVLYHEHVAAVEELTLRSLYPRRHF